MNDFMELCLRRQSCRKFDAERPVESEKLVQCVKAARLAPSACNSQPWTVVVVENRDIADQIALAVRHLGLNNYIAGARAFFVVLEEHAHLIANMRHFLDSQYFAQADIWLAAAHLCLEAAAQDLGTCILGVYDRDKLRELLDIPQDKPIRGVIAVGYPADPAIREKKRKPLEQLMRVVK